MVSRNLVVCIALCVGALGPERGENESFFEKEVAGVRVIAFSAEDLRDAGKELSEEEGLDFDELYASIAKCAGIEFEFLTGMNTPTIVFAMSQAADERQCGFEGFPIIRRTLKPSKRKLEEHCDLGFFENEDECTPCNHAITYCSECENGSVCTLCEDGFYTSGSECLKCQPEPSCSACNVDGTECTICGSGFYLESGTCELCDKALPGCEDCDGKDVCSLCEEGTYLSSSQCVPCDNSAKPVVVRCPVMSVKQGITYKHLISRANRVIPLLIV